MGQNTHVMPVVVGFMKQIDQQIIREAKMTYKTKKTTHWVGSYIYKICFSGLSPLAVSIHKFEPGADLSIAQARANIDKSGETFNESNDWSVLSGEVGELIIKEQLLIFANELRLLKSGNII